MHALLSRSITLNLVAGKRTAPAAEHSPEVTSRPHVVQKNVDEPVVDAAGEEKTTRADLIPYGQGKTHGVQIGRNVRDVVDYRDDEQALGGSDAAHQ